MNRVVNSMFRVFRAVDGSAAAAPGTLVDVDVAKGITVATGDGLIGLTRVQAAGDSEQPAAAWARAQGLTPGDRIRAGL